MDDFVSYEKVKWSETLKRHLLEGREAAFTAKQIRQSLYRPFVQMKLYYDSQLVDRPGAFDKFLPTKNSERENLILLVPGTGARSPFWCLATRFTPNLNFVSIDSAQSLPIYTYSDDGRDRRDNITPQAVSRFQKHYGDPDIAQPDVFHFCYAMLHHPAYRLRYGENLKHDLPRIPVISAGAASPPLDGTERSTKQIEVDAATFWAFADTGERLTDLHVNYEHQNEYPLQRVEGKDVPLNWRVEKMKLSKDRRAIRYNDFLTLAGIPQEVFAYRLGNRSALEWVIDQYCVTRGEHGNITSDPNRSDDEQYIVRLIGQVVTVSLETLKLVGSLPELRFA